MPEQTTLQQKSNGQAFGMFLRGMLMNKSDFKPEKSDDTFYTLHIGIPGNTQPIGVRVSPERYHKAEIMSTYDHKVNYTVSRKNGNHYFEEA